MKRILIIIILFLSSFQIASAQAYIGSLDVTGAYSFNLETPGINFRSYLFATEEICFGPEFTYFFPVREVHGQVSTELSVYTIDLNAHYFINLSKHHSFGIYPILGIDYTREKEEETEFGEVHEKTVNAIGLNTGIGFEKSLFHRVNLFSEFIHTFSELEDNVLFLGVNFHWGGRKKSAKHHD